MPLIKRLPHRRGFTNIFRVQYNVVNVGKLAAFAPGTDVTPAELLQAGLISTLDRPTKVLGHGEIRHPLQVTASKFSESAEKKILAAGGQARQA